MNYLLAADRIRFRHTVVCLDARGDLASLVDAVGIPVRHVPISKRHLPSHLGRLARLLRSEGVSVVHAHMHDAALWGRVAGRLAGVPVMITTEHGKELWKGKLRVALDHHLSRWTARHSGVSRDGMELRRQRERLPQGKMTLIPNGVRIPPAAFDSAGRERLRNEFGLPMNAPVLGTVGRIVAAKGYEYLLEALVIVRRAYPDARWIAIGDGDQRADLSDRACVAGLSDAVVWAGRRSDIDDLLCAMDVWVMSSVREGLPVALLEAMAVGRPIVATDVGGIPEAVRDGREGLIVPAGDPGALARAIGRLLGDPAEGQRLGRAARARAESDYSIATVAGRIERVYVEELARIAGGK